MDKVYLKSEVKGFTFSFILCFLAAVNCAERKDPIITIVNIGHSNRIEIGKQLAIISEHEPKIIALDFYLVSDSLDRDSILVNALQSVNNTVQVVGLHDLYEPSYLWDSLEVSHPKFKIAHHGFANLAIEDSVLIKELPMAQAFYLKQIHSFSYMVAKNSIGVKERFKNTGDEDVRFDLDKLGKNYTLITSKQLFSGKFTKGDIKDKIVLMGYLGEEEDCFYIDEGKTRKINGVEVHAAIIEELIDL
jgi:CHASE2 domain-containing sensor protein